LALRKFFAALLIALIVAPFTEPWPVCPLPQLMGDPPVPAVAVAAVRVEAAVPVEGAGSTAIGTSPGSMAPGVINPITLLPPFRTNISRSRVGGACAPTVSFPGRILRIPVSRTAAATSRSDLSVPPPLTPALRV
jgi:hypothetical protein